MKRFRLCLKKYSVVFRLVTRQKYFWRVVLSIILFAFSAKPNLAFAVGAGNYDDPWQLGNISYFYANGTSGTPFFQYGPTYPGGPCSGCFFDTQSVSSVNGESVDQTFTGNRITWWNTMALTVAPSE